MLVIWDERDGVMAAAHTDAALARAERRMLTRSPHLESAGEFNRIVTGLVSR